MTDKFFSTTICDRCGANLTSRIMSWFTTQTICMKCSIDEGNIKKKLREQGKGSMEGCGYIPVKGTDY